MQGELAPPCATLDPQNFAKYGRAAKKRKRHIFTNLRTSRLFPVRRSSLQTMRHMLFSGAAEAGEYQLALDDAMRAEEVAPAWPKPLFRRGVALRALKRYDMALSVFAEGTPCDFDGPGEADYSVPRRRGRTRDRHSRLLNQRSRCRSAALGSAQAWPKSRPHLPSSDQAWSESVRQWPLPGAHSVPILGRHPTQQRSALGNTWPRSGLESNRRRPRLARIHSTGTSHIRPNSGQNWPKSSVGCGPHVGSNSAPT